MRNFEQVSSAQEFEAPETGLTIRSEHIKKDNLELYRVKSRTQFSFIVERNPSRHATMAFQGLAGELLLSDPSGGFTTQSFDVLGA